MIISATTLKDNRQNVEKFVRRNLLGGIDHLVDLLDAPIPEVEEFLDPHPDVTPVRAYGDWWAGEERGTLDERRSSTPDAEPTGGWLSVGGVDVELDGDEVAQIDRAVLDRLDPSVRAVQLTTMEAVSSDASQAQSHALQAAPRRGRAHPADRPRGDPPGHGRPLRGHVSGKPGLRPSPDLALGLHHIVDIATGERLEAVVDAGLTVLHYESYSGQEFVRKWMALLSSGSGVKQHGARAAGPLHRRSDGPGPGRAVWLERLFGRYAALDDVDSLSRLRLLVEIHPRPAGPGRVSDARGCPRTARALLDRAYPVPKKQFRPRATNPRTPRVLHKPGGGSEYSVGGVGVEDDDADDDQAAGRTA